MTKQSEKSLLLHIGSHKTGTTSIQAWSRWLSKNKLSPYHYCTAGLSGDAHYDLSSNFAEHGNAHLARLIRKEVEQSEQTLHCISSEGLGVYSKESITDLCGVLASPEYQLIAAAAIRGIDTDFESAVSQRIKTANRVEAFTFHQAIQQRSNLIHSLLAWIDCVGRENFRLMIFDKRHWPRESLWSAWWQLLGLDEPVGENEVPGELLVRNESLSALTLAVAKTLAERLRQRKQPIFNHLFFMRICLPVETRLRELGGDRFASKLILFTPQERKKLVEQAAEIEQALFDKFDMSSPFPGLLNIPDEAPNISTLLDPLSPEHPDEQTALYRHLLEYADALSAEILEELDILP